VLLEICKPFHQLRKLWHYSPHFIVQGENPKKQFLNLVVWAAFSRIGQLWVKTGNTIVFDENHQIYLEVFPHHLETLKRFDA